MTLNSCLSVSASHPYQTGDTIHERKSALALKCLISDDDFVRALSVLPWFINVDQRVVVSDSYAA